MDIKQTLSETAKSAKFEGCTIDVSAANSRLQVAVHVRGSVDPPGDLDEVVAQIGGLLGLGKSQGQSNSSAP